MRFVVLDGAKEGIVVGGAIGRDFCQKKMDVPGSCDGLALHCVL